MLSPTRSTTTAHTPGVPFNQAVQSEHTSADGLYQAGLTCLSEKDGQRYQNGVALLKEAAGQGHPDAKAVLRSLCDGFARSKIDSRSDETTWSNFKALLFAAYQPWERFALLQGYPHVLAAMLQETPIFQALRKEIYQSNAEAANQGNADALHADGLMQYDGFGVDKSLIGASRGWCLAREKGYQEAIDKLPQAISELENQFSSVLNKVPDEQNEMYEADQFAVIEHIRSQKKLLTINEQLKITHADIVDGLHQLINEIKKRSGYPATGKPGELNVDETALTQRFAKGLAKCEEKRLQIVTKEVPLQAEIWLNVLLMTTRFAQTSDHTDKLTMCNKQLLGYRKLFRLNFLKSWVVVPLGRSPVDMVRGDWTYLEGKFIPDGKEKLLQDLSQTFLFKTAEEQNSTLTSFFDHAGFPYKDMWVNDVKKLINNDWFKSKLQNESIKLKDVLLFPGNMIRKLGDTAVQQVFDNNPSLLSQAKHFSPDFWMCLTSTNSNLKQFLSGEKFQIESFFRITRQGRLVLEQDGVYEFLKEYSQFLDSFVNVNLDPEELHTSQCLAIHRPFSHPVIQNALVIKELNLDKHLRDQNFVELLCGERFLDALNVCPELLGQVMKLDSALSVDATNALSNKVIQRMLATKMLTLNQLNQICTPSRINIDANILIDAAVRKAIPTDVTIKLTDIDFGSLPEGHLTLPHNIRLISCHLGSGVLRIGEEEWHGPCTVTSEQD